jgi:lipopolysaccharide/colanic/teichoic acid biosynthesis glycosyltransferase
MPTQPSRIRDWLTSRPSPTCAILPAAEMRHRIDREKARCDRNGRGFSLIVFDLTQSPWTKARARGFAKALAARLRRSDDAGWVATGKLAVLLPECGIAGAWSVRCDVQRTLCEHGGMPPSEIVCYPEPHRDGPRREPPVRAPQREPTPSIDAAAPAMPAWKRGLDIVGASVGLVLGAPLLLAIALLVRMSGPGPVIFRQWRAGRFGVPFVFFKFRTMVDGAEAMKDALRDRSEVPGLFKMRNDPRVTRIGAFLRRTSLDELPQLWNVLRGDMSLVGPRPATLDEVRRYEPWHRQRLAVPQGLTGAWQVAGRGRIGFPESVRMDVRYARWTSLGGDLRILWDTVGAVITSRGAH